jgi:CheY-like chemotaxis protein
MPLLLLVEDEEDIRTALADILTCEGYGVCEAAGRSEGLAALRAQKPDLVIVDYSLPKPTDGIEFLRIKASEPGLASIPVILTSGFTLPSKLDGVVAMVTKPFDLDEILALIQRFAGPPRRQSTSG